MGPAAVAEALMGWWALAGVDSAVGETPVNWLRPVPAAPQRPVVPAAARPAETETFPPDLDSFHAWLGESGTIPEAHWPSTRVLPSGPAQPPLMVLCDAPDAEDAGAGSLLSGAPGSLFDGMMAAIGLTRADVYLTSLAIARPPGGLWSESEEPALVARMRHHVALVEPNRLLLLGERTIRAFPSAGAPGGPAGLHPFNHARGTVAGVTTHHPRILLRQPAAKADCWRSLQKLIEASLS